MTRSFCNRCRQEVKDNRGLQMTMFWKIEIPKLTYPAIDLCEDCARVFAVKFEQFIEPERRAV